MINFDFKVTDFENSETYIRSTQITDRLTKLHWDAGKFCRYNLSKSLLATIFQQITIKN